MVLTSITWRNVSGRQDSFDLEEQAYSKLFQNAFVDQVLVAPIATWQENPKTIVLFHYLHHYGAYDIKFTLAK